MICTLTIKCVWGAYLQEPFQRTVEVPDDMTLGELHNTRRLTTILSITTVFFLATRVYIILRRPRDYW